MTSGYSRKPAPENGNAGPLVSELAGGSLNSFPVQPGRVAVVEFYADWSGRSRQLESVLRRLAPEFKGLVVVGRVNVERNKEYSNAYGVGDVPDVRIYRDGSPVDRFTGLLDDDVLREKLAKQVKSLPAKAKAAPLRQAVTEPMKKGWMPEGMRRR